MFEVKESDNSIRIRFSSRLAQVNRVVDEVHVYFHQLQVEESELHDIKLALRELLNNAVEHGNKNNETAVVKCTLEHTGANHYKMIVKDQGDGFHHKNIKWDIPEDPAQTRSRGLPLVNRFCDRVTFNKKGNQVTVHLSLTKTTTFSVSQSPDDDYTVITPKGNITAPVESTFRLTLQEQLDQGRSRFRFDFHHVSDIDSIGLSVLVLFARQASKTDGATLEIINLSKDLSRLFHMTRLDKLYRVSVKEA